MHKKDLPNCVGGAVVGGTSVVLGRTAERKKSEGVCEGSESDREAVE